MQETTDNYPFNYDYKVYVSLDFVDGEKRSVVNPSKIFGHVTTVEEWDAMTDFQKKSTIKALAKDWAYDQVDYGWHM